VTCPACGKDNLPGAEECESCQEPLSRLSAPQATRGIQKRILEGKLSELKPRGAISVAEKDFVRGAVETMRRNKVGCVLVMEGGRLKGILTERDILYKVAPRPDGLELKASEVMVSRPETLGEEDNIAVAFHKMAVGGYRHLPVLMKDGSYGILSARDLLSYLCR